MPNYFVACNDCEAKLARKLKRLKRERTEKEYEDLVLFETAHKIKATEAEVTAAMTCPRCNGTNCVKTLHGYGEVVGYVRGQGYLDVAGCKRDMNLCKLTEDDPYADMRQPGEVDDLKLKLKKGGRHNPKPKHFAMNIMEKAVRKSVSNPSPSDS